MLILVLAAQIRAGGCGRARELGQIADFARRHDLILVSDEIHCDLLDARAGTHTPMALIDGITTAGDDDGGHQDLQPCGRPCRQCHHTRTQSCARAKFAERVAALGLSPNAFGLRMMTAAYSPKARPGWNELMAYVAENARIFDAGIDAIPGLPAPCRSSPPTSPGPISRAPA